MRRSKYSEWTKEELIKRVEALEKRKKYGLVWDEEKTKEKFEAEAEGKFPVLKEIKAKEINNNPVQPTHILIEGDNYHALSVLNYTHERKVDVIYIDPPYNTGAKDWKYNNDYVDKEDAYRHSKWLSFMNNRLRIAKRILKTDGILIVTIDDNELLSILGILDNLRAKTLGRVAICIKPEGRRQSKYFMEAHEYALFVTWGNPKIRNLNSDFGLDFPETDKISKYRWEGLMRRDLAREDRKSDYWYPFYYDENGKLSTEEFPNSKPLMPINTKGIERVWLWDKDRAQQNLEELKVVVRKGKATVYYKRREQGRIKPTTFWYGSKYNANAYGTRLLDEILPKNDFDYPKSLYSVLDCIDLFLPPNGLVLDFFAGSGTTGHAALELNRENKGNRTFILCTNNENNICSNITYPRIKKIIQGYVNGKKRVAGYGGNLKYFKTAFVPQEPTDKNRELLTKEAEAMLCLRENAYELVLEKAEYKIYKNNKKYLGIVWDQMAIDNFKNEVSKYDKNISVYVFSLSDEDFSNEFADMKKKIKVCSIPEAILRVYRRIFTE